MGVPVVSRHRGRSIAARLAYRAQLPAQFLWASQQALEKYLKCILFIRRIPPNQPKHALRPALDLIVKNDATPHSSPTSRSVAAALGNAEGVRQILDAQPEWIRETRPSGRRPLSAAVESGHDDIAGLLLERGADPKWPEPTAPEGRSLQVAASAGNLALVKLLLAHGADPDSGVDSSGTAVSAAATPEIRALLEAHGGTNDPYDTTWIDKDDEVQRVAGDPRRGTPHRPRVHHGCWIG